jgi:hypothetical protein
LVRDPPRRVAAILETLRPAADEIVVAVDAAGPGAECPALAAIADKVFRVSYEPPFERYLAWLHGLCDGDWIFRIDGDEVPSVALVGSLASLLRDRSVLQYRLPRRWLFRDAGHWLAGEPWQPDYQIRIVRNDPATLRFRGTLHSSAEAMLPARFLEESIYHLALLVTPFEEREERVRHYEALAGPSGRVDNSAFYLPDLRDGLRVVETPPEDKALIERAVLETPRPACGRTPQSDVRAQAVEMLWAHRNLGADAYNVEIVSLEDGPSFAASEPRIIPVRIRNRGDEWFPWGDWSPLVRAAFHWLTPGGDMIVHEGQRTLLTNDLLPGNETVVPLLVVPPPEPGRYILEIDLVHEGMRWFDCGTRVPATVEAPLRSSATKRSAVEPAEGRLVCVTGMHRSGTSLVARIVNLLGIYFGPPEDLVPPAKDNPAGFWEHRGVVSLNDEVLSAMGGSAVSPPTLAEGWEASPRLDPLRERAAQLVCDLFDGHRLAGWKDPRMSLTLPFWRTVTSLDATVLVVRHPLEAARSLAARDGISEDDAARLYVRYLVSALRNDPNCTVVRHDELFTNSNAAIERLARSLGLDVPDQARLARLRSVIDPGLRHHRLGTAEGAGPGSVAVAAYRLLVEDQRDSLIAFGPLLIDWASMA